MKVVHVITDMRMGGAEGALARLALATRAEGHDVEVVALKQAGEAAQPLLAAGIPVHALGAGDEPGPRLALAVLKLAGRLRSLHPDVVHAWLASGCAAVKLAAPRHLPRVYAARVTDVPGEAVLALLRSADASPHAWLAVSGGVADAWSAALGMDPRAMSVIVNGVDRSATVVPEVEGARPVVLARLAQQKGVDVLIRAVDGTALHVDVFGDGPDRAHLEDLAHKLDVSPQVHFHGVTREPREVIRRASMLVLPSRSEGMPNAVLEAMAEGRAVVATDIPGTREVVTHGVTGMLVPPDNPGALRAAMQALQDNPARRMDLGLCGHDVVGLHFSHAHAVRKTLDAYRRVLEAAHGAPP